MEDIIIHKNQTEINQFLLEENKKCPNCRWLVDNKCSNSASEFNTLDDLSFTDTKRCEHYYPLEDEELFNIEDEDTGSLF